MKNQIEIIYADEYRLGREGVIRLLSDYPELHFRHSVSNGRELLDCLEKESASLPDIVLIDINLPFVTGVEAFKIIRQKYPRLKVVILTEHFTDKYIHECMLNGAKGYLSKNCAPETLAETINRVHKNGICIDPMLSNILERARVFYPSSIPVDSRTDIGLNSLQMKVLKCMLRGLDTQAISAELNCAYKTAEHARSDVWRISNCKPKNFAELMEFAFKHNLVTF
jgi:DNA-binding NarL/FixJ family response regulator